MKCEQCLAHSAIKAGAEPARINPNLIDLLKVTDAIVIIDGNSLCLSCYLIYFSS